MPPSVGLLFLLLLILLPLLACSTSALTSLADGVGVVVQVEVQVEVEVREGQDRLDVLDGSDRDVVLVVLLLLDLSSSSGGRVRPLSFPSAWLEMVPGGEAAAWRLPLPVTDFFETTGPFCVPLCFAERSPDGFINLLVTGALRTPERSELLLLTAELSLACVCKHEINLMAFITGIFDLGPRFSNGSSLSLT